MLFVFFTTSDGADLGRRFFSYLGNKLSMLLANITSLEPINLFASRPQISKVSNNRSVNSPRGVESKYVGENHERLHRRFRTLSVNESVISSVECFLKNKRKATLYLTPKHICVFSTSLGLKKRVRTKIHYKM